MSQDVDINTEDAKKIIDLYKLVDEMNSRKKIISTVSELEDESKSEMLNELSDINKKRKMFIDILGYDEKYITNVLVKYLKADTRKDTLWKLFGESIYENICNNIPSNTKLCSCCGERFEYNIKACKPTMYCKDCANTINKENMRRLAKISYKKSKSQNSFFHDTPQTLDYQRIQRFYFMNLKNEIMTIRERRILYFMCEEQNSVFPNLYPNSSHKITKVRKTKIKI